MGRALVRALREFTGLVPDGAGGFKGAEVSRLTSNWLTSGMTFDERLRSALLLMRRRAREITDNNAYGKQFLNLLASNVIGPAGMRMRGRVLTADGKPNSGVNRKLEAMFQRWADGPVTLDGRYNLVELEDLLVRTMGMDGEIFIRKWNGAGVNEFGFALEPIDADLVDEMLNEPRSDNGNEIRLGVEVDPFGAPLAYHVWDRVASTFSGLPRRRRRIPAEEIIHVFKPDRVMQTRGATMMLASMFPLKQLDTYEEAELVAANFASSKMGFFQQRDGMVAPEVTGQGQEQPGGPPKRLTMEVSPGELTILPAGYEFQPWDPNHPTTAYADFIKGVLRKSAAGLGISYNAFANDLEGVNYSSMRSGLLIERDLWRGLHRLWGWRFRAPVYRGLLAQSILTGEVNLPAFNPQKFWSVDWIGRGWPWVDPLKDGQAAALQLMLKITSRSRILAERGEDFEDVLRDLRDEEALAAEYGVELPDITSVSAADVAPDEPDVAAGDGDQGGNGNGNGNGNGSNGAAGGRLTKYLAGVGGEHES